MLLTYKALEEIARNDFSDIVKDTALIGGRSAQPNKLRIHLKDGSFLDVWRQGRVLNHGARSLAVHERAGDGWGEGVARKPKELVFRQHLNFSSHRNLCAF
jgi:hypothetical protein